MLNFLTASRALFHSNTDHRHYLVFFSPQISDTAEKIPSIYLKCSSMNRRRMELSPDYKGGAGMDAAYRALTEEIVR